MLGCFGKSKKQVEAPIENQIWPLINIVISNAQNQTSYYDTTYENENKKLFILLCRQSIVKSDHHLDKKGFAVFVRYILAYEEIRAWKAHKKHLLPYLIEKSRQNDEDFQIYSDQIFEKVDLNQDKFINFDEYKKFIYLKEIEWLNSFGIDPRISTQTVELSRNELSPRVMEQTLFHINSTDSFQLIGYDLKEIPIELFREIHQGNAVEKVNLRLNNLIVCPPELTVFSHLTELNLSFNTIPKLENIIDLRGLRKLDLSNNLLVDVIGIGQLSQLVEVNLSANRISSLSPEIGLLNQLISLDLNMNRLTRLPDEITHLTLLKELDLGNNQLESIPESIGEMNANLYYFILCNNKLTSLPISLGQCKLQRCIIDGNLIADEEIMKKYYISFVEFQNLLHERYQTYLFRLANNLSPNELKGSKKSKSDSKRDLKSKSDSKRELKSKSDSKRELTTKPDLKTYPTPKSESRINLFQKPESQFDPNLTKPISEHENEPQKLEPIIPVQEIKNIPIKHEGETIEIVPHNNGEIKESKQIDQDHKINQKSAKENLNKESTTTQKKHSSNSKLKNETNKREVKNKRRSDMVSNIEQEEKVSVIKSEEKLKPISTMIKSSDETINQQPQQPQQPKTPKAQPQPQRLQLQMRLEPELGKETNIVSPQIIVQTQPLYSERKIEEKENVPRTTSSRSSSSSSSSSHIESNIPIIKELAVEQVPLNSLNSINSVDSVNQKVETETTEDTYLSPRTKNQVIVVENLSINLITGQIKTITEYLQMLQSNEKILIIIGTKLNEVGKLTSALRQSIAVLPKPSVLPNTQKDTLSRLRELSMLSITDLQRVIQFCSYPRMKSQEEEMLISKFLSDAWAILRQCVVEIKKLGAAVEESLSTHSSSSSRWSSTSFGTSSSSSHSSHSSSHSSSSSESSEQ